VKVSDLLNVRVTDIALGGKAVARHEGRVLFVDRGLPGDQARVRIARVKPAYAEARLEAVEEPSPWRVAPPCPHVGRCGGCRFQDLAYASQCAIKGRQVQEALSRIGGQTDFRMLPLRPAPELFRYRNKMEFSFHPAPDGTPILGLHERGTFDRVFALETCFLPSELTVEIVRLTQRFAVEHGWRAYHPARHMGVVRFLTVRHLGHTDECAVQLVAAADQVPRIEAWARALAALSPAVRTVTLGLNRSRANIASAEEERSIVGEGVVIERLLGLEFEASANTFLQTNSDQAEALYAAVLAAANLQGQESVLDLYCGAGTLTLLLAQRARLAIGVESVAVAVEGARRNAGRNAIENVRFVAGEARRVLREWARGERPDPPAPEVVVVDPPRAGLHPRVVARIAELRPTRVIYVSCNPATLARDIKDFADRGYRLAEVEPFDLFPHTPHIECVARLEGVAVP
jgi:23S rRNA (uracil1939-C5)-methyltransferase